jgi:hypothetical protein
MAASCRWARRRAIDMPRAQIVSVTGRAGAPPTTGRAMQETRNGRISETRGGRDGVSRSGVGRVEAIKLKFKRGQLARSIRATARRVIRKHTAATARNARSVRSCWRV